MAVQGRTYDHESLTVSGAGGDAATIQSVKWNYKFGRTVKTNQQGLPNRYVEGEGSGTITVEMSLLEAAQLEQPVTTIDITLSYANDDQDAHDEALYVLITSWEETSEKGEEAMVMIEGVHYRVPEVGGTPIHEDVAA